MQIGAPFLFMGLLFKKVLVHIDLLPPSVGCLKFSFDGSSSNLGPAGALRIVTLKKT